MADLWGFEHVPRLPVARPSGWNTPATVDAVGRVVGGVADRYQKAEAMRQARELALLKMSQDAQFKMADDIEATRWHDQQDRHRKALEQEAGIRRMVSENVSPFTSAEKSLSHLTGPLASTARAQAMTVGESPESQRQGAVSGRELGYLPPEYQPPQTRLDSALSQLDALPSAEGTVGRSGRPVPPRLARDITTTMVPNPVAAEEAARYTGAMGALDQAAAERLAVQRARAGRPPVPMVPVSVTTPDNAIHETQVPALEAFKAQTRGSIADKTLDSREEAMAERAALATAKEKQRQREARLRAQHRPENAKDALLRQVMPELGASYQKDLERRQREIDATFDLDPEEFR